MSFVTVPVWRVLESIVEGERPGGRENFSTHSASSFSVHSLSLSLPGLVYELCSLKWECLKTLPDGRSHRILTNKQCVLLASWEFTGELEREKKTEKWYRETKRGHKNVEKKEKDSSFPAADL